jgi:serpin B
MYLAAELRHGLFSIGDREIEVLQLPYGRGFSMVVLLPADEAGITLLEERLSPSLLRKYMKSLKTRKVRVFLPRFGFSADLSLKAPLVKMGMVDAFISGRADFSGIAPPPGDLFASQVFHSTYIAVDEEGTEASSATAVHVKRNGHSTPTFRADRPFLFLICHDSTGILLFMGKLFDPGGRRIDRRRKR